MISDASLLQGDAEDKSLTSGLSTGAGAGSTYSAGKRDSSSSSNVDSDLFNSMISINDSTTSGGSIKRMATSSAKLAGMKASADQLNSINYFNSHENESNATWEWKVV
jgi:hypothetical protein